MLFFTLCCQGSSRIIQAKGYGSSDGCRAWSQSHSMEALILDVEVVLQQYFQFWFTHGPDSQYGGYYGTLDREGKWTEPLEKSLVAQSRYLWSFSTASRLNLNPQAADQANIPSRFLSEVDRRADGAFYPFLMTPNGSLVSEQSGGPNLYAHFFVILSLAAQSMAFKDPDSLARALATFRELDNRYHDPTYGGWDETDSRPSLTSYSKSYNTHLHGLEALTELSFATNGADSLVLTRLEEMVSLMCTRIYQPSEGRCRLNFDRDWSPQGSNNTEYGHDLQTAHILLDALEALNKYGTISNQEMETYTAVAYQMAETSAREGFDSVNGGYLYEGPPGLLPITATDTTQCGEGRTCGGASHTWWVQCEAMLGLWKLYNHTSSPEILNKLNATWTWFKKYQWDTEYGEAYWWVDRRTKTPRVFNTGDVDYNATIKANMWKASYHTGKSLMFLSTWMRGKSHR